MQTASDISDVLGGFAKSNPADLAKLSERSDWQALAKWEATRRAAKLLELFDDKWSTGHRPQARVGQATLVTSTAWDATVPVIPEDATVSLGYGVADMPQR